MTTSNVPASATPAAATTPSRGRFIWHDLMTRDLDGAIRFYKKVCGWETQVWDAPGMPPYTMFAADAQAFGGLMALPADTPAPPHWVAYVTTPDVDATVAQAQSLGATIMVPARDIPEVGRFAVITDPQGALFAVYTPKSETPEPPGMPGIGLFSWHELATTDHVAALDFYAKLFGWEKTSEFDMGSMGVYVLFGRNGEAMGGMFNKPADMPFPPNWLPYVHVDSADAAAERVTAAGGTVMNGPMDVPGGRITQCMDPQGGMFAVHSVTPA